MLTPKHYAALVRLAALLLGAGSLSWSASNPERLRLMLGSCSSVYRSCEADDCGGCRSGIQWSGCEELARELAVSGTLLLLAGLPANKSGRG